MGREFTAICNKCAEKFKVREGGGLHFYLLHCNTCGKEKIINEAETPKIAALQANTFFEKVEQYAGKCDGGHYKLNAKARCTKCNSDDYRIDASEPVSHYD